MPVQDYWTPSCYSHFIESYNKFINSGVEDKHFKVIKMFPEKYLKDVASENIGFRYFTKFLMGIGNIIYFICDEGEQYVKIGKSKDPVNRKASLQTANPLKLKIYYLIENSYITEKKLHKKFEHLNTVGEWFKFDEEIKNYIKNDKARRYKAYIGNNPFYVHRSIINKMKKKTKEDEIRRKKKEAQKEKRAKEELAKVKENKKILKKILKESRYPESKKILNSGYLQEELTGNKFDIYEIVDSFGDIGNELLYIPEKQDMLRVKLSYGNKSIVEKFIAYEYPGCIDEQSGEDEQIIKYINFLELMLKEINEEYFFKHIANTEAHSYRIFPSEIAMINQRYEMSRVRSKHMATLLEENHHEKVSLLSAVRREYMQLLRVAEKGTIDYFEELIYEKWKYIGKLKADKLFNHLFPERINKTTEIKRCKRKYDLRHTYGLEGCIYTTEDKLERTYATRAEDEDRWSKYIDNFFDHQIENLEYYPILQSKRRGQRVDRDFRRKMAKELIYITGGDANKLKNASTHTEMNIRFSDLSYEYEKNRLRFFISSKKYDTDNLYKIKDINNAARIVIKNPFENIVPRYEDRGNIYEHDVYSNHSAISIFNEIYRSLFYIENTNTRIWETHGQVLEKLGEEL